MSSSQKSIKSTSRDKKKTHNTIEHKKKAKIRNTAEALVLSIIQKLEKWLVRVAGQRYQDDMGGLMNDLRIILDLLQNQNSGESPMLNHMIADAVEMVQDATALNESSDFDHSMRSVGIWVAEIKARMLKLGVDGVELIRSDNVDEVDVDEEDVVGMEEDVKLLLGKSILNGEEGLSVPFITGMVGIGKTALARQLYNHGAVVKRFKLCAWVRVSTDYFSHKEILLQLLKQMADTEKEKQRDSLLEKMDNRSLQKMLHKHLQGKPYFIVLDDVPKEIHLRCILKALPDEDSGSRLLFTSRSQIRFRDIKYVFIRFTYHVMKALDSDKSWQLFLKTIDCGNELTSEQKFPKKLERKGREMLTTCGGVPSAIKEVGKQLAAKRELGSEWEELLESVDLGESSSTLESLESSYQILDAQLKSCFLHLAFFVENKTIRSEKFIQIMAAGGMASLEEIKNAYLTLRRLTKESMIEVKDSPMRSFRVNPLLHRLSIKKATEEIGFEILRRDGNYRPSKSARHCVINCSRDEFTFSTNQDEHLVSLFFHGGGNYHTSSPSYWKRFKLLRLLDFEDFGLKIVPESIGTLVALRYLGLRNNHLQELPHSLGCLINLEVLDIALNFMVVMPDIIWKMRSLRHLFVSDVIWRKPLNIDVLQNLQILTYISIENWTSSKLSGLRMMTNLKKLGIEGVDENSEVGKLFSSLAEIKPLDNLSLRGFRFKSMPSLDELGMLRRVTKLKLDGLLANLPSADNFPSKLTYLKLVNTCLDEDPMPILEELPKLRYLKLKNAYIGREMVVSDDGFSSIKVMSIEELWNLTSIQIGEDAMSGLTQLEIKNCPYLETLPDEIGLMDNLEELKMVTTKKVATKIKKSSLISKRNKSKSEYSSSPFFLVMNDQF